MRIEKEGFVLHLEGTWCEISNKYAVLESGDVAVNEEDIPAGFAEKKLDRYIETHKIRGYGLSLIHISKQEDWLREIFNRAMTRAYKETEAKKTEMYEKGKTYIENYEKYGCTTWYDWCTKYWGTKWNAYSNEQRDEDTIEFETAWSNPEPVMLKLSEMYPEATIEHWWADEDMGSNDGYRVYSCLLYTSIKMMRTDAVQESCDLPTS